MSSSSVAMGYRLLKYAPGLLIKLSGIAAGKVEKLKSEPRAEGGGFNARNLIGPPPGTEADIAEVQWGLMGLKNEQGLRAEIAWATSDWGFDHYGIPGPLDFFCGAYDYQAPFALVLADQNADARFHAFGFGHNGFSHPDARRRIVATVAGYFS